MIKHVLAAVMLVTALAGAASAAESKSGEIKSIDAKKMHLTLTTGDEFQLPKAFDVKTIKVGEKVMVTYDKKGNAMVATDIKAM